MKTIYLNSENIKYWKNQSVPNVIALGFFDGIHKGHQKVIHTAVKEAKEKGIPVTVMSFFPHPKTVISNGKEKFDYIMPLKEKAKVLESLGVNIFYIVEFDKQFASLSPEEYVARYLTGFNVVHAVAGYDFSYGKFGAGNMERMKADSNNVLEVTTVEKVEYQGEKISSTWIRDMLSAGEIEELPSILGRPYELECEWNGLFWEPLPYYSAPAAGTYSVTIHHQSHSLDLDVVVSDDRSRLTLLHDNRLDLATTDRLSITWHNRIRGGAIYSYTS